LPTILVSKLILSNSQSPGDIMMLTAAVRDLQRCAPGRFVVDVRTPCAALWENNPHLSAVADSDPEARKIECEYPLIHQSNTGTWHFIHGFHQFLGERLEVNLWPTEFKGDIHLSEAEKRWMSQVEEITRVPLPFWIVVAGGKFDYTAKWWDVGRMQAVVDHFRDRILFVQVGEQKHYHPPLQGVLDLRGKTDLRQLVRLMYHAQGVLCPVTFQMHLAAAVETLPRMPKNRPCVVVAGGREPAQWEAYPHHQYIHTNGSLLCCDQGGCWKSRVVPLGSGEEHDEPRNLCVNVVHLRDRTLSYERSSCDPVPAYAGPNAPDRRLGDFLPRCLDLIPAEEVIRRIELYFEGGAISYLDDSQRFACQESIPDLGWRNPTIISAPTSRRRS
jgi:ADP-heptose:LPS heptosyltransferase